MHLTSHATTKYTSQTVPGELISLHLGSSVYFALVLANENNSILIGIVSGFEPESYPFYLQLQNGSRCVSYSTTWVLEPFPSAQTWTGNQKFAGTPGVVHLTHTGSTINFGPRRVDWQHSAITFHLETNEISDYDSRMAAPILSWSIWEDCAAYDRQKATPLVRFELNVPT